MSKQSSAGPVDELRRVRVPDGVRWTAHLNAKADGGRGVMRHRAWDKDQPTGSGTPRADIRMSPLAAVGLHRFLRDAGALDEVRPGPPSVMPRLNGPRRVDVGSEDVEVRWAAGFDGDRIRLDAVDVASGSVRLALEVSGAQARVLEQMIRIRIATAGGGPEFSGMPR